MRCVINMEFFVGVCGCMYSWNDELREVLDKILKIKPAKAYVFFNNNQAMLMNSRGMLSMFKEVMENNGEQS